MTINYDTIKKMAKEQGIKVNDLIALSSANDPYYVGKPASAATDGALASSSKAKIKGGAK